jgi:hypothetical protein
MGVLIVELLVPEELDDGMKMLGSARYAVKTLVVFGFAQCIYVVGVAIGETRSIVIVWHTDPEPLRHVR